MYIAPSESLNVFYGITSCLCPCCVQTALFCSDVALWTGGHAGSMRGNMTPIVTVLVPSRWYLPYKEQRVMISRGQHALIFRKVPEEGAASRLAMAPADVWFGRKRSEPSPALL